MENFHFALLDIPLRQQTAVQVLLSHLLVQNHLILVLFNDRWLLLVGKLLELLSQVADVVLVERRLLSLDLFQLLLGVLEDDSLVLLAELASAGRLEVGLDVLEAVALVDDFDGFVDGQAGASVCNVDHVSSMDSLFLRLSA